MRFAYCRTTGEEPAEVVTPGGYVLDGEGRLLRCIDGTEINDQIAASIGEHPRIATYEGVECEWRWRHAAEQNESGDLLLNLDQVARDLPGYSRYNGGWTKQVTGLNETVTNGFSILGDMVKNRRDWCPPGLYLTCSIGGSRAHPRKNYQLFRLHPDGVVSLAGQAGDTRDWATNLWPYVREALIDIAADLAREVVSQLAESTESTERTEIAESTESTESTETTEISEISEGERIDRAVMEFARALRIIEMKDWDRTWQTICRAAAANRCLGCEGLGIEPDSERPCPYCRGTGTLDDLTEPEFTT